MVYQLSIIIVNWNTKDITAQCIESIFSTVCKRDYEIIIVDNGSSDNSVEFLSNKFKGKSNFRIIPQQDNLGFAKANNLAIRKTTAPIVLLLNSDTIAHEHSIDYAVKYLQNNNDVGVVGCKLLNKDGSLQRSCSYFPNILTPLFGRMPLSKIKRKLFPFLPRLCGSAFTDAEHNTALWPDWIMGAFMLCRREAINDAGLLDEAIFMYREEMEWCYRIKRKGWRIAYLPEVSITHLGGVSSSAAPLWKVKLDVKSMLYFFKKHHGRMIALLFSCMSVAGLLAEALCFPVFIAAKKREKIAETICRLKVHFSTW